MAKIIAITITIIFSFSPGRTEAFTGSTMMSATRSELLEALEGIPIPHDSIADQDQILGKAARRNLADRLHRHCSYLTVKGPGRTETTTMSKKTTTTRTRNDDSNTIHDHSQTDTDYDNTGVPIQIAVVIVEGLGDDHQNQNGYDIEEIAGQFAISLHNIWGIGHEIIPNDDDGTNKNSGGGTGILVFLSVRDRVVFVSVGGALSRILTNSRIDRIIQYEMRPYLKLADYERGLTNGIDAIAELLE